MNDWKAGDAVINGQYNAISPTTYGDMNIGRVDGLTPEEQSMFEELVATWQKKLSRNSIRRQYYDGKNHLKDLGIAIPPPLRKFEEVVGWPAKAVDDLAARSRFDGFVFEGQTQEALAAILRANGFKQLYRQATNSELIHSCSFIVVSKGDVGEPDVLMSAYSALTASALYDTRKKRIKCGVAIIEVDKESKPTWVNLYTDDAVIVIKKSTTGWGATRLEHAQGRPLMEPLIYSASLDRPFGKSRISRAVMSITDAAVRTALRTEVTAEFYSAPQKYILGASDDMFKDKSKWEAYIGNIFALNRDEDGEVPTFGQLPQMTMQPHFDHMRSLAARFSGETGIPISSLGVVHDNPASAEAIYAAKEDLIIKAEELNDANGSALRNIGLLTLAIAQDKTIAELSDEERSLMPRFKAVDKPSVVSQADAMIKQVSAIPWIAETTVALEQLGYTEDEIARMLSDKRRAGAVARIEARAKRDVDEE